MTNPHDIEALETARRLLAAATGCATADVGDDAAIGAFEPWDSLAHMRLIMAIEEETAGEVPPEMVVAFGTLADIAAYLESAQTPA